MGLDKVREKKKKKMRSRYIYRASILLALAAAVLYALVTNLTGEKVTNHDIGDDAPNFELVQVNKHNEKEKVNLSELKGKGVMLNFWGTWCAPCRKEMPYMESLYPEYKEKGVEIVAVNLDQSELKVNQFIEEFDLTFPVPHDVRDEVRELYGIGPLPSTVFINPEGVIDDIVIGALTLESLEAQLKNIQPK
ncbi:MAG TPA: thiol-disulfide oxidoreductase ResA [Pseudogracilibacillus sp.]|nr:thiol-disulfide oxidoreductase ResA [Pseudogracilibacillus sp.]